MSARAPDATQAPMFDTHAHIMSADDVNYPPSAEGRESKAAPYPVEQLLADMDASNVTHACAVQRYHYYLADNSYVLDAARPHGARLSPVVMLDGLDAAAPAQLRAMAKRQRIGALRFANTRHDRYDTSWMNAPATMRLWEAAAELSLPVAIIFYIRHLPYNLPALALIAERFPDTPIVVDHMGAPHAPIAYLPLVGEGKRLPDPGPPDYGLSHALKELGAYRNVHFKLTGINLEYLEAHGVHAAQFVRRFVDEFGAERVMCGTDIAQTPWPYARLVAALRQSLALLNEAEHRAVLFDSANRVFGPSLTPSAVRNA